MSDGQIRQGFNSLKRLCISRFQESPYDLIRVHDRHRTIAILIVTLEKKRFELFGHRKSVKTS